ncbi:YjeF-related protein [Cordyceps fumosorosea ARSEF 2679]|uniref:Enhancer of mRNA-decapping protein 3 n=1 Tax=Cordyceps fumosorosea (strain ARSEF 2679) TaxID=1081104 RepID=A0A168CH06_CORFA|nr:YjeF-related protein [Cordyceps fumosorosea ARSEF 2679]OAA71366.1 YjeF-related protein [Cordyceps fumosorosea ARSEF 2679]
MASQFIGLHMQVVLREPPGYQLHGTVTAVEPGISLSLKDVFIVATQKHLSEISINALDIKDVSELSKEQKQQPQQPPQPVYDPSIPTQLSGYATQTTSPRNSNFVDPAILSMGRRPGSGPPPASVASKVSMQSVDPGVPYPAIRSDDLSKGDLDRLFKSVNISKAQVAENMPTTPEATPQRRKARNRNSRQPKNPSQDDDGAAAVPGSHGKGWRQTPILQSTASFQPYKALKKNGKASKKGAPDNGWASEDVTEDMPDFDFENNLAKFPKSTLFDQMRKDDAVKDSDRLVSHNRKPKAGTAGGKNLHYTENVLDLPASTHNADYWNSEAEVGGVNDNETMSGREQKGAHSNKRTDSKSGPSRRSQSRKASAAMGGQPLSRVNSSVRQPLQSRRSSPRSGYRSAEVQPKVQQPGLYLVPSNRRVEAISTLQMLNLENIAANEIGLSESLMAENAGRGIAEVAVEALSDPALKVRYRIAGTALSQTTDTSLPNNSTIVILAGNHKSSIRALVAGRHLRNKGYDVMVCLVGIERERDLLEDLRLQIQLYRNFGGKVLHRNDFFEQLRKSTPAGAAGAASGAGAGRVSVSLIIDALLGLTMSFEELRGGDQATVYELMEWANRNEAFVLSIDVPSGIDPSTGKVAIIDGSQLFVKPRYVVAVGAPKRGLVEAVTPPDDDDPLATSGGVAQDEEWRLYLVDMGLGHAVWRKAGTKVRKGIDFEGKWLLEMKYRGVEEESDDY